MSVAWMPELCWLSTKKIKFDLRHFFLEKKKKKRPKVEYSFTLIIKRI